MIKKLVLFAVVALGLGMAVPTTRAMIQDQVRPILDGAKAKLVPNRLDAMANQLEARVNRGEGYPTPWEIWLRRDYAGVPEDPWGNVYYLQQQREGFLVGSMGPDGIQGNEDDITVSRSRPRRR